ncbi:hypothetical protein BVRB_7g162440 [Beta vulgaris subsp. vulgaris]|nr:hypothetical protein BVRB_7g162440 [Beta vulgaris subsp. vulgaris]
MRQEKGMFFWKFTCNSKRKFSLGSVISLERISLASYLGTYSHITDTEVEAEKDSSVEAENGDDSEANTSTSTTVTQTEADNDPMYLKLWRKTKQRVHVEVYSFRKVNYFCWFNGGVFWKTWFSCFTNLCYDYKFWVSNHLFDYYWAFMKIASYGARKDPHFYQIQVTSSMFST